MIDSDKRSIVLLEKIRFMIILRMFMVLRILVNSGSVGVIVYVFYSNRSVRFSLLPINSFSVRLSLMRIVLLSSGREEVIDDAFVFV